MAGHNKWSQIKRRKEKTDAEKSKVFGKMIRLISIELRRAKGNANDTLVQAAVERAREQNVPSENIERALKRSDESSADLEKVFYESYGPGGSALIIETLTNNKNKTVSEIKHILKEVGLELAAPGSAMWAFDQKAGRFEPKNKISLSSDDESLLLDLISKLESHDDVGEVYTNAQ